MKQFIIGVPHTYFTEHIDYIHSGYVQHINIDKIVDIYTYEKEINVFDGDIGDKTTIKQYIAIVECGKDVLEFNINKKDYERLLEYEKEF